ncbi:ATP-binding sensor histidine kinase [Nostoc sp. LPT]|uniref:trifunctional serine/threonine-protein kinase/ATP-binding protein/sensor histidine kinase n=1 Tax=Nostoc sp. LPT TaxID=2815387 RepID=UPI001E14B242|nr:ATP-binding sensor histidine kinase [Nostoc sp. LPT]MBN4006249.1 AAA family ATPase [Nostoc sp. LPT]
MVSTFVSTPGYHITEELYNGSRTLVYRGYRETDSLPIVIKLLKNPYPSLGELLSFRNQYTIAKNLNSPLIIQTYSLEPFQNGYALVMEDFGGISLKNYFTSPETRYIASLQQFLEIAIALCNTLDILYRARIIHKDIKPANILINPETKQVKLIDFSIASLLPRETQNIQNANALEGTLAYLSPEQTGRMNRGIDYRSDFYSLGVTFYELLTGQLPFISDDPMELVHCHLAKNPIQIHQINPNIPLIISEIISKLINKNAEARYESALGIKHDLEVCLSQLKATANIEYFTLGERDISDRFTIPEKLYGRETEVSILLQTFEKVSLGATEMMLVAGFSGIGKTAVVNEVHKPIVRQRGYFIKGKYDQFGRNIPFSAFVQAFRDLMGQLLSESDAQLQTWKTKILEAVGENGQVLIDVIPSLKRIIGKQPPVTELSGTAAQNRFNLLMQKFVQIFTSQEHPLVMFLDDLQWADSASLKLLQLLMSGTGYLLILGAYRDNEISPAHPFILTVDEIVKTGAVVNTITLQSLSLADMNQLVADTLNCKLSLAHPLTELVVKKTKGNPFFATQFLKALYEDGQITFDPPQSPTPLTKGGQRGVQGGWQCDIAQVRALALTDDVVEFMALQLQKLPNQTQNVLKLAACIGAQFDLNTLAIVSEQSLEATAADLWKALQEGLIIPNTEIYKFFIQSDSASVSDAAANPTYRFLHDRIQQAAYSLILDHQKQITHLEIATLLLRNSSETHRQERIFDIVGHFNLAAELITEPHARYEFATLNLQAGKAAKAAAAFDAAFMFVSKGIDRLPDTKWQDNYPLTLALYDLGAGVAYLCSQFEQTDRLIASILQNARNLLDQVSAYETKILSHIAQNQIQEAVSIGLDVLRQLGLKLPKQPTKIDVLLGLAKTKLILGNKKTAELIDLPKMSNPKALAIMRILSSAASATYICAPQLMPLFVFERINLSVRYGNTPLSAVAYAWYGMILCGVVMDIEAGYQFGQLALQVLERFNATDLKAQTLFINCILISHWREPVKDSIPLLLEAYQTGLETGDVEYATWAAGMYSYNQYCTGKYLSDTEQTMRSLLSAIAPLNQKNGLIYLQLHHQVTLNLLGHTNNPSILSGESYQAAEVIPMQQATKDHLGLFMSYVHQQYLHYLFEEYAEAVEKAKVAKLYLDSSVSSLGTVLYYFYDSLARLAVYPKVSSSERQQLLKQVKANQKKLQKWAFYAPSNYQHKFLLVEAEQHRILKKYLEAIALYDRAIQLAKENQYLNEEALANELAAKFYLDWGKEKIAQVYMTEAYYCYTRWGAKAKVIDLETRYPLLILAILQKQQPSFTPTETMIPVFSQTIQSSIVSNTSLSEALDLATILKASQSLSSEIELEKLLSILLEIILKNAGADKCALLMPSCDDRWVIEAFSQLEHPTIVLRSRNGADALSLSFEDHQTVPVTLINRVKNTLTLAVIDNALIEPTLAADPYILRHSPKSIICAPILNQSKLIGILYLENNLTVGAFTSDRLQVLKLLTSQAAISLENAQLYRQLEEYSHTLERKVEERTQEITQKATQLESTLEKLYSTQAQLIQSEKMSGLGQLVAGIAHEINNPINFIYGNLEPASEYVASLIELNNLYQQLYPQPLPEIAEKMAEMELEFLVNDLQKLLSSMRVGADRICQIVLSLRKFSRLDESEIKPVDIHSGIDSTLLILQHRLQNNSKDTEIAVIQKYGQLPLVNCYVSALNQVFMNIINNAIDALKTSDKNRQPTIVIKTELKESNKILISIADNGIGMSKSVQNKIFNPFFTTKSVGSGTGLGLSTSYSIVVEKHGGQLSCISTPGEGTEFFIEIPV